MPRSAATCAIRRPLSSAKRTPHATSSSGYFLGQAITWGLPLPRTRSSFGSVRENQPGSPRTSSGPRIRNLIARNYALVDIASATSDTRTNSHTPPGYTAVSDF
jgi:hypothetical protein